VEAVVEGDDAAIAGFLADLNRVFGRNIDRRDEHTAAATGEFNSFEIRC
jgi:hypothetical protein